jgi:hypothetical protein
MTQHTRLAAILAAVAMVVLAVTLSPDAVRWVRTELPFANAGLGWLELKSVGMNATHVLLFFAAALVLACAMPGPGLVRAGLAALAAVAVIAVASEALQWLIPGRTPRLADIRDDLVGGAAGLALGLLLRALWRAWRSRRALAVRG